MNFLFFCSFIFLLIMTSCSVGPSYTAPFLEIPCEWKTKQSFKKEEAEKKSQEYVFEDHWWEVFKDEKLNALENMALQNNKDLFIAFERVQEAKAYVGVKAADFYPQVTLDPAITNTNQLIRNYNKGNGETTYTDVNIKNGNNSSLANLVFRIHQMLYMLPINISYEVDLWGKIRDAYDSAVYNWEAQEKDYQSIMLTLTSNLAIQYFQLRIADSQLDLLSKIQQTRQKAFQINKDRYEEEISNYSDVTLAGEELDSALIQYIEVKTQRQQLENGLAVLLGIPASEFTIEYFPLQRSPPLIPAGIPSEVLLRRPDIAEAELTARSQQALVKQVYAQFFPSLTLTAAAGYESPFLKYFLDTISKYWMQGTRISQLIFDGRRTEYEVDLQLARFREASGTYQQQVLRAFQEVEDALDNVNSYEEQYAFLQNTVEWAEKSYALYSDRFILGVINYIDVVNTERDLLNYQISLHNIQGYRYVAAIQLIKALGGGWENTQ